MNKEFPMKNKSVLITLGIVAVGIALLAGTTIGVSGAFMSAGITSSFVSGIFFTFFWPSRNSSGPRMSS